jgi:hypothetical protein
VNEELLPDRLEDLPAPEQSDEDADWQEPDPLPPGTREEYEEPEPRDG